MEHYDLQHYTRENSIEFEIVPSSDDGKKFRFRDGEPVRLFSVGDTYYLSSLEDRQRSSGVKPVNAHAKSIVEDILSRGNIYLAAVLSQQKGTVCVSFKQFSDEKLLRFSIWVSEDFFASVRKSIDLKNVANPKRDIEDGTLYRSGGDTYAVVGVHVRAGAPQALSRFVIAGRGFYIQVSKAAEDLGNEYYAAEKILKKIPTDQYCFFLVSGQLNYTTDKERIAIETQQVMESLTDDSYIQIWDRYGRLERETIMQEACDLGALKYESFEPVGRDCRFDIRQSDRRCLDEFSRKFEPGAVLSVSLFDPFDAAKEGQSLDDILSRSRGHIVNVPLADTIDPRSGSIFLTIDGADLEKLSVSRQGYIFTSIMGDKKRLDRREQARARIESRRCPMPHLSAVLEGKSIASAARKKLDYPALSESVKEEIFTKKGVYQPPTAKQEMAIRIALNTPDIALIQGPPGTGKTTVITAILKRLNEIADPDGGMFGRDLVTAFQHDAVENAINRIEILGLPAIKFGRKYRDADDSGADINESIQGWINDRLSDLYTRHSSLEQKKYLTEFNKLRVDYLYSANSIVQTLDLLERIRDLVDCHISAELLEALSKEILELQLMTGGEAKMQTHELIRAVRRIPTSETAYEDNGRFEMRRAIRQLQRQQNPAFVEELSSITRMLETGTYDFEALRAIRRQLLTRILPKRDIFTTANRKDSIERLLGRISDHLLDELEGGRDGEEFVIMQYIQSLEEEPLMVKQAILNYSSVNGATNQQAVRKEIIDLKDGDIAYDNVLVDEAARSNPLDLFIPMSIAKDRIILVGDHRQLPHMIDEQIARKLEDSAEDDLKADISQKMKESMFAQLFTKLQMLEKQDGIKRTITLDRQYRMHPTLGTYIDNNFYRKYSESEHVGNGIEDPAPFSHRLPGIENKACVWYNVPYDGETAGERAKSKFRRREAEAIARHVKKMLTSEAGRDFQYGIITFYREQVNEICRALAAPDIQVYVRDEDGHYRINPVYSSRRGGVNDVLKVGTVDAFQGMEFDVVYLSMVRSNDIQVDLSAGASEVPKRLQRKYGFLMFENRLCVAMSRQKRALICVGDSAMLHGQQARRAVEPLVNYYNLCREDAYGAVIQ